VFGTIAHRAKAFFAKNNATLLGYELIATESDRLQPVLSSAASQADVDCLNLACNQARISSSNMPSFDLPYPRSAQSEHGGCLAAGVGNLSAHGDGGETHARHASLEGVRQGIHRQLQRTPKPLLDESSR